MRDFHRLTVSDVRRETPDAVSIAFAVPEDLRAAFGFEPGQHLTVRADIDGAEVRRTYSICRAPDEGEMRVAIRRQEGGAFSSFASDRLEPGMALDVMPPSGRFTLPPEEGPRHVVAFAAGSGITPIMAIVRTLLAREPDSRFTLFYGNRATSSILFRDELEDLKDRYLGRFRIFHFLTREPDADVPLFAGRLDGDKVKALATRLVDIADVDAFFLCGPGSMIADARQALKELGIDRKRIRSEHFVPVDGATGLPLRPAPTPPKANGEAVSAAIAEIEVIRDGARQSFAFPADAPGVIDAALAAGITLPYSCKGGMCCTCRAKVLEGEAEMARNYSLEPWELEEGYVLSCQARPTSAKLVLDYDQV